MNSNNAAKLSPTDEFRPFLGVDDYCFGWGGKIYEVHEDGDGYRSYVGEITEADAAKANAFVGRPVLAKGDLVPHVKGSPRGNGDCAKCHKRAEKRLADAGVANSGLLRAVNP